MKLSDREWTFNRETLSVMEDEETVAIVANEEYGRLVQSAPVMLKILKNMYMTCDSSLRAIIGIDAQKVVDYIENEIH